MTIGLFVTTFLLGLRHGIDVDHVAAISELTSGASSRRRGFVLSVLYAAGHAVVVAVLGVALIAFGATIPEGADEWMGRVVGATLVALGLWILASLARNGREFRLRSRWILVLDGTFAGVRRVRRRLTNRLIHIEHDHEHEHEHLSADADHDDRHAHDHTHAAALTDVRISEGAATPVGGRRPSHQPTAGETHSHRHTHELVLPGRPGASYEPGTAAGIGMLHGIGVESPTQIAVFVLSTAVAGTHVALVLLAVWIAGLMLANAGLAAVAAIGLLNAERNFALYVAVAIAIAVGGIVVGLGLLTGNELV